MIVFQILFYLLIGLLYLGVSFPYQELLIGVSGVVIGVMTLAGAVRKQ